MKTGAIIGISGYGRHHLLMALEQTLERGLKLVAATVVNQAEEAFFCQRLRGLGCEIFSSTRAMWAVFKGKVDLCFIPTGIHLHAPMTIEAIRAGASVFVEKPLTATSAEAARIMKMERATGQFAAVGFQDLYTDSTWAIKELLLRGGIGKLQAISFVGLWPRPVGYYRRNDWAGRLRRGGRWVLDSPVNNAFAHFLNLALFWSGPEPAVSARVLRVECELYRAQPIESFDTCCVRASLSGDCELRFYLSHSCHEDRVPKVVVEGSRGKVVWAQESHYEVFRDGRPRQRHPVLGKFETKFVMADAVMRRLVDPKTRICTTAIATEHVRLVQAIHAATPIVDIPTHDVRRRTWSGEEWYEIAGIEAASDDANAGGKLWSETGIRWARKSASRAQPR